MDTEKVTLGTGSAIAIVTGAILFKIAFAMKNLIPEFTNPIVILTILIMYAAALGLVYVGVTGIDMDRWGTALGYAVLVVLLLALNAAYLTKTGGTYLGTDGILFTRYSVDLLLSGQNPYAHSMAPAFEQYPIDSRFVTYRVDGTTVKSISYPALSFLLFVPQALLGVANLNLTAVVILMLVLAFLVYESPSSLSLVPFAIIFADPNLTFFSFGGVFDILWVLPLLFGMRYWHREQFGIAAAFVGFAFAIKQTPWFIGPFLAVWLYMESETYHQFGRRAGTCLSAGGAAFLLPNLPFIIWNFDAWMRGTLTPISSGAAPLVQQGSGLTLLSVTGLYTLPKSYFTLVMLSVLGVLVVIYALYFEKMKWAAWIFPALVLWFNYRSLQNYFIFFIPLAYYSALLKLDLARTDRPTLLEHVRTRLARTENNSGAEEIDANAEVEVNDV